jgi:hypothetical protein
MIEDGRRGYPPGLPEADMTAIDTRLRVLGALFVIVLLGSCGSEKKTPSPYTCSGAGCSCEPGLLGCGSECVAPESDPDHCGGCTKKCPADLVCAGASCRAACYPEMVQCGRACADVRTSILHCGSCDTRCGAGEVCAGGTCVPRAEAVGGAGTGGAGDDTGGSGLDTGGTGSDLGSGGANSGGTAGTAGTSAAGTSDAG